MVTHFHADRLGGAAALQRRGIAFPGHPLTAGLAATLRLPPPRTLPGLARAGGVEHVESAEVFYPGPAHTRDNVVVWLPKSRVLVGGCAVRAAGTTALGNVADADVREWPRSIRRVLERYGSADVVVPGHGKPGGRELLEHTIALAKVGK
ncbi:MAG TPA: MBL fold metallo-hydrolase, partial [Acidobacteriota bacterium]|nr:MBL fold metallo-hydrolase [Acidobacteriota bacterium]